jgi:UDP-2,3-diacylglucosamine pyrophosphatase LpxH
MLVIISDLHLTDGTTGSTIGAAAFEDFRVRLQELATDASHRAGGRYEPVEGLDLVLLGDVFDLIRSTRWSNPGVTIRPWEHRTRPDEFADHLADVTAAVLRKNADALAILRACSRDGAIRVAVAPEATETVPVPVRIHYVVGNHDWFYHLPGPAFDAIRMTVNETMGLSNDAGPYAHDLEESDRLMAIFDAHRVYARHGDRYDSLNYEEEQGRDGATLGDALVVELINRFPHEVRRRLSGLPTAFLDGLDELANVRPSLIVPVWIDALVNTSDLTKSQENEVKVIWNELADAVVELPFVRERDKMLKLDEVDALQATLHLSSRFSFGDIARIVTFIRDRFWKGGESFASHALKEPAYKEGRADHIVYGHTHHFEAIPLNRRRDAQGHLVNQLYFNSGTWHAVHEQTRQSESVLEPYFVPFHVMTYLAFFRDGERSGRAFETWSGTLGMR